MDTRDASIFKLLGQIADTIVATFPRNMEVVVHDLSEPRHSIVHIAGDVTHRKVGGPLTDMALKYLAQWGDDVQDCYNYRTKTKNGRVLKSSTTFIRNEKNHVIAAICMNFDTTDYLNAVHALEMFSGALAGFNGNEKTETFAHSIGETIEVLFQQAITDIGKQPSSMSKEEKIRLVSELENSGVFQIKGAVDQVALLVGVSKFTIYNYLKEISAKNSLHPL